MTHQRALIEWRDAGVPISSRFDDPYFSLQNGLEETRYVFLRGNDLPARARPGFHIAELGFGTGLNLLTTWDALRDHEGPIHFTSFEAFPICPQDMARALAAFPALDASELLQAWGQDLRQFQLGPIHAQIIIGDARETLPTWQGRADAWYLDGFAPAKNPELWSDDLMAEVAQHTAHNGTFATYTAVGTIRRALQNNGFEVNRIKGFGHKRHMSIGRMR